MKLNTTTIVLMLLFFVLPCMAIAQPGFGDDVDDVPVDGGLSLLVVAGAGYGIKKMRKQQKAKDIGQ